MNPNLGIHWSKSLGKQAGRHSTGAGKRQTDSVPLGVHYDSHGAELEAKILIG